MIMVALTTLTLWSLGQALVVETPAGETPTAAQQLAINIIAGPEHPPPT